MLDLSARNLNLRARFSEFQLNCSFKCATAGAEAEEEAAQGYWHGGRRTPPGSGFTGKEFRFKTFWQ